MLSAVSNEEWSMHSYPFTSFGDMESEIAELRTLTKVTKLRQQIECKQEGAWLVVRNVPDDKSRSGTRKVTSYGRSSRSVTRSVSQNVSGGAMLNSDNINNSTNVVIEHPLEDQPEKTPKSTKSSVEITEVSDEPSQADEIIPLPSKIPVKKTSVVTLGKGNIVLMDDEDSNFQVTGISKGRVADAVSTLERVAQGEKKVKKVGFCKTEVHFAPDSGRVNIVETDEKPPPTQMNRKKKRPRVKNKSDLPKLYFGNTSTDISSQNGPLLTDEKQVFSAIKEPSSFSTYSTISPVTSVINENSDTYGYIRKISPSTAGVSKKSEDKSNFSYLGNVSPKLSKLLQNNMQHEFQAKQKQIWKNLESSGTDKEVGQVNLNIPCETGLDRPLKIVTQVSLGDGRGEVEHKFMVKSAGKASEPIYINKEMTVEIKNNCVTHKPSSLSREKVPKPRPRTTVVLSPQVKEVRCTKTIKQSEKGKKVSPRPKEATKKDNIPVKSVPKPCSRNPSIKLEKRSVKSDTLSGATTVRSQKLMKSCSIPEKQVSDSRVRKAKEPLRSFEKVSNGWVGHCITPFRTEHPKESQVNVTSRVTSEKSSSVVHCSQGTNRRNGVTTNGKLSRSNELKAYHRTTLSDNKQFSLSKEHLRSAKLVKELTTREKPAGFTESRTTKKTHTTVLNNSSSEPVPSSCSAKPQPPRVGVVKPRVVQHNHSAKTSAVSVRIGLPRTEHSAIRSRRDSDQSDDSVVRADEEVRAYMFNTRHKVLVKSTRPAINTISICGDGTSVLGGAMPSCALSKTMEEMTASYTEICDSANPEEPSASRPTVLELPDRPQADFLNLLDGTVTRHGDLISFVAGDLEAKIKLSSPPSVSRQESSVFEQVTLVEELETEACLLAASVDSLTEVLSETLHGLSALTVDCLETYRDVVCKACDSIDNNIKAMYQLMAKCEEMSKSMQHVHKLDAHIKNVKHLLDMFEALPS